MRVTVTVRHMDDQVKAENLRSYVLKKIKRVGRHIKSKRNPSEVKLILGVEKFRNTAEVFVNSGTFKLTSSVEAQDMYAAIDRAIDSIIRQLKKQTDKKIKIKRRGVGKSREEATSPEPEPPRTVNKGETENIGFEKVPLKPMSVEEAMLQLKVAETEFLTFRNSETGEINTLCKRKGGRVILIAP